MITRGNYQDRVWWDLRRGEQVRLPELLRFRRSMLSVLARARKAGYTIERATDQEGQVYFRLKGYRARD